MKMVSQVDWYTCVMNGVSFADFLTLFGYDPCVLGREALVLSNYSSIGGRPYVSIATDYFTFQMRLEEIRMTVEEVRAMGEAENVSGFQNLAQRKINNVRIDFSGSQLQNMRIDGLDPEGILLNPYYWSTDLNGGVAVCTSYHPTRLDIAYDFVDHEEYPNIVKLLCEELLELRRNDVMGLNPGKGHSGGQPLQYEVHYDSKSCGCYLGKKATKSEFLRVYDKHLEQCQKQKVTDSLQWNTDTMYRGCKSWTRFELQSRDDYAAARILMHGTPKQVIEHNFLYAYEKFIRRVPHKYFPVFDQYVDLGKFAFCIIADTASLKEEVGMMQKKDDIRSKHAIGKNRGEKTWLAEAALHGVDYLEHTLRERFKIINTSEDPAHQAKQARLNEYLNAIALAEDIPVEEFRGLKQVNDHYELKSYEELKAEMAADVLKDNTADELEQVVFEELKI